LKQALGMIEVRGLSTGILIADTMAKTANIQIYDIENTKGLGYMTVKVVGDVGAVNSAISAAKQEAIEYGKYIEIIEEKTEEITAKEETAKKEELKTEKKDAPDTIIKEEIIEEKIEDNVEEVIVEEISEDKEEHTKSNLKNTNSKKNKKKK